MSSPQRPLYLDCNATTPVNPEVAKLVMHYMVEEFGNAGSRTHEYGLTAKKAVARARLQVATAMGCATEDVIFTSGATESNNLAILGLEEEGNRSKRRHIISTPIEHKAVLEPLARLSKRGFEVEFMPMDTSGAVRAEHLHDMLRPDTLLVSIMHANNETGVIQPIEECCDVLKAHEAFFHADAAQTATKVDFGEKLSRVNLLSLSAHKFFGPKGIGALVARGPDVRQALAPLQLGGGQELGLRAGTVPVPLVAGLGLAIEIASKDRLDHWRRCLDIKNRLVEELSATVRFSINGTTAECLPHVINLSFEGVDSEALLLATKHQLAIATGSACTSARYERSHVLQAMRLDQATIDSAVRISWHANTVEICSSVLQESVERIALDNVP